MKASSLELSYFIFYAKFLAFEVRHAKAVGEWVAKFVFNQLFKTMMLS